MLHFKSQLLLFTLVTVIYCLPARDGTVSRCQTLHRGSCINSSDQTDLCTIRNEDNLCTNLNQVCCVPKLDNIQPITSHNPAKRWHPDCGVNKFNNTLGHVTPRKVRRSKRVIGGVEALVGQIPWQVSLLVQGAAKCGGVLINGRYVLTAAHCVECAGDSVTGCDLELNHEAMLGAHSLTKPTSNTRTVFIESAVLHPDYDSTTLENDLALLRLNRDIAEDIIANADINTACAPDPTYDYTGMICYMSGWGKTGYPLGPRSDTLHYVDLPVVSKDTCCTKHCDSCSAGDCVIYDHNICAGHDQGDKDACSGDSGGPLVCEVDNIYSVVGINSWGDGCARPSSPGVYTSVASFLDWIDQVINTD